MSKLELAGQDLGSGTASVSSDGEYEWWCIIAASDFPQLLSILGAPADANILDVLEEHWSGANSYKLEQRISESNIPTSRHSYGG